MAIVNGVYVQDPVGDTPDLQKKYFGTYTKRDISDYSQAALQIRLKELENQYNLDVWNLQNEYNTPAAQMARYQDAGLNPNLIYGQSNPAGDIKSASSAQPRSSGNMSKGMQTAASIIGQMLQTVRAGREIFDYVKYGMPMQQYQNEISRNEMYTSQAKRSVAQLDADFATFLANGPSETIWESTPRYSLWKSQKDSVDARYNQMRAMIGLISDQRARQEALKALDEYRLQILQGQNDAILNINTGYGWLDSVLKLLGYWAFNQKFF